VLPVAPREGTHRCLVRERDDGSCGSQASTITSTCSAATRGITRSSGCCSLTQRMCSASDPRDGCHASPSSSARARRIARSELPPTQISGCGDGCGCEVASWNDQNSPSKSRSPLQSVRISRIASSARRPRPLNSTPMKSNSCRCQPIHEVPSPIRSVQRRRFSRHRRLRSKAGSGAPALCPAWSQ
jgi:hypothetical protein